jgi:hypothetical protein
MYSSTINPRTLDAESIAIILFSVFTYMTELVLKKFDLYKEGLLSKIGDLETGLTKLCLSTSRVLKF